MKRHIVLFAAALLLLSCFAGCGNNQKAEKFDALETPQSEASVSANIERTEPTEEPIEPIEVSTSVLTDPAFVVGSGSGQAGENIAVTVSMVNNPGIIAAVLRIAYDAEKLELIGVQDSGLLAGAMFGDSFAKNPYYLSWNDGLAPDNNEENGVLATLEFRIVETCPPGDAEVRIILNPNDVYDWDLNDVEFQTVAGSVSIAEEG